MEAALGFGLAIAACCGLPIAMGGVALLLGKRKRKGGFSQADASRSMFDACCQAPATVAKRTVLRLHGKAKQGESTPAR